MIRPLLVLVLALAAIACPSARAEDDSGVEVLPWGDEITFVTRRYEFIAKRVQNLAGQYDYYGRYGDYLGSLVPNYSGGFYRYDSKGTLVGEYVLDYSGHVLLYDINQQWRIMDNPWVDPFSYDTLEPGFHSIARPE